MGNIQGKYLNYGYNETVLLKFYGPVLSFMTIHYIACNDQVVCTGYFYKLSYQML